ncbi:MAG: hypothetical protein BJ554DRAFT_510, partial [Olpidium bornovanus]
FQRAAGDGQACRDRAAAGSRRQPRRRDRGFREAAFRGARRSAVATGGADRELGDRRRRRSLSHPAAFASRCGGGGRTEGRRGRAGWRARRRRSRLARRTAARFGGRRLALVDASRLPVGQPGGTRVHDGVDVDRGGGGGGARRGRPRKDRGPVPPGARARLERRLRVVFSSLRAVYRRTLFQRDPPGRFPRGRCVLGPAQGRRSPRRRRSAEVRQRGLVLPRPLPAVLYEPAPPEPRVRPRRLYRGGPAVQFRHSRQRIRASQRQSRLRQRGLQRRFAVSRLLVQLRLRRLLERSADDRAARDPSVVTLQLLLVQGGVRRQRPPPRHGDRHAPDPQAPPVGPVRFPGRRCRAAPRAGPPPVSAVDALRRGGGRRRGRRRLCRRRRLLVSRPVPRARRAVLLRRHGLATALPVPRDVLPRVGPGFARRGGGGGRPHRGRQAASRQGHV